LRSVEFEAWVPLSRQACIKSQRAQRVRAAARRARYASYLTGTTMDIDGGSHMH